MIVIVNENGTQTTINADGTKTIEVYTGSGEDAGNNGSTDSGNDSGSTDNSGSTDDSGTTDSGNNGNTDGGGSVDPNPVNSDPAAGETYSIQAGVGSDGGSSVTIKKNGVAVAGNSVEATGSDTVVIEAVPETANYQFMSWSDGNSQPPAPFSPALT